MNYKPYIASIHEDLANFVVDAIQYNLHDLAEHVQKYPLVKNIIDEKYDKLYRAVLNELPRKPTKEKHKALIKQLVNSTYRALCIAHVSLARHLFQHPVIKEICFEHDVKRIYSFEYLITNILQYDSNSPLEVQLWLKDACKFYTEMLRMYEQYTTTKGKQVCLLN